MIAVCLLTCDRPELTEQSVWSFVKQNNDRLESFLLLHCDGGSHAPTNCEIAKAAGFRTLVAPSPRQRIGQMTTLLYFLQAARKYEADWIVWLENDWESVAPLPSDVFIETSGADTIRLFGAKKFRDGPRQNAGPHRIGTNDHILWEPWPGRTPGWEMGLAHWGAGGTMIRTDILARCSHLRRLKDVITHTTDLQSLRPLENIMWSIGHESTEGIIG